MVKTELGLYELVLLMKFTTVDETTRERIDFYRDFITSKGSQIMVKNHGKKSLAYPIKGFDVATYVQIVYLGNDEIIKQVATELKRDDFVLRGLTSKLVDQSVKEMFV